MNDTTQTMTDESDTPNRAESHHTRSDGGTNTPLQLGSWDLRTVFDYLALAGLALFAFVSAIQLYSAVGGIINELIASEYRVFFRAAFNLVVLLLCVGGISMQLNRLS